MYLSFPELYLPEQFEISSTLREPQRYIQSQENPILEVLADQVNNDTTSKLHGLTGTILLNRILDGLESGSIKWPIENTFIDQETWSEKMFYDHSFYSLLCKDVDEWKKYEQLLIYLASQLLQKKIVTIRFPFNNDSTNMEFTADSITTLDEHLYLFSCDFAMEDSCHISIVKKGRTVRSRRKWLRSLLPF